MSGNPNPCRAIEKEMLEASLETEKEVARKHLDELNEKFKDKYIVSDGVRYKRLEKQRNVSLGRVSLKWTRPVYEGSIGGKTVYLYPADNMLSLPEKGYASYETLTQASVLSTFVPFETASRIMSTLRGSEISESSVQRYAEATGQFAKEGLEELLEGREEELILGEDEILVASLDGTSSMITGNNRKKKKKKAKKPKSYGAKKKR